MAHLANWINETSSISNLQVGVPSLRRATLSSAASLPWYNVGRHNAAAAVKQEKKKDGSFTKDTVKKLSNRSSSDDSDSGPCWSDYERDPSKKAGENGSCRPKKKKRKKAAEGGSEKKE